MITITINTIIAKIDVLSEEPQSCQSHLSGIIAIALLEKNRVISERF